jgi:hypothetical protein
MQMNSLLPQHLRSVNVNQIKIISLLPLQRILNTK